MDGGSGLATRVCRHLGVLPPGRAVALDMNLVFVTLCCPVKSGHGRQSAADGVVVKQALPCSS